MKATLRLTTKLLPFVAWVVTMLNVLAWPQSAYSESTKVVVMIVMTTTVGDRTLDINRIKESFSHGVAAANRRKAEGVADIQLIIPEPILLNTHYNREAIFQEIRELIEVDKSTTFVFYYSAHGAVSVKNLEPKALDRDHQPSPQAEHGAVSVKNLEPKDLEAKPILVLDYDYKQNYRDYIINRDELLNLLEKRGARLTVLMTECCAEPVYTLTPRAGEFPDVDDQGIFRDLFLKPEGIVDISSSSYEIDWKTGEVTGQLSWVSSDDGGLFTKAFHSILMYDKPKDWLRIPPEKAIDWDRFLDALRSQTSENFQSFKQRKLGSTMNTFPLLRLSPREQERLRNQKDQTPFFVHPLSRTLQPGPR